MWEYNGQYSVMAVRNSFHQIYTQRMSPLHECAFVRKLIVVRIIDMYPGKALCLLDVGSGCFRCSSGPVHLSVVLLLLVHYHA